MIFLNPFQAYELGIVHNIWLIFVLESERLRKHLHPALTALGTSGPQGLLWHIQNSTKKSSNLRLSNKPHLALYNWYGVTGW